MDLNQQFGLYEEYVKATLGHFPVDQTKLNCIAVFKALAELTDEQKLNGAEFITREMLQTRVSERYAANANARRQEVNKYLSQRFRIGSDIEPDFVQFMLEGDSTVYSRADNVDAGSKRTAYRIADFPKKDKLIALLRRLDLTLYLLPKSELTLQGIFTAYLGAFWPYSSMQKWHENYAQFTRKLRSTDQITDEQLTQLWGKQSNGIALIKQGVTPAKEVVSAKNHLLKITSLLKNLSNNNRYQESLGIMDKASEDNSISRRYFSVLNRTAVAFDSANLTFPVDSNTMLKFVRFMNDAFNLNIDCKQADWYELSTNLKKAVAGNLAEDVDPLKVNIVLWRINDQQDALKNLLSEQSQMNEPTENDNSQGENNVSLISEPLNQILYGPPGTGKTYHAIEAAVKAAEPEFKWQKRDELKAEYDRLVAAKRIRFVTFHQSYGYEEFVEGLKAKTTEDKSIEYFVENGAFKSIADDAKSTAIRKSFEVSSDATIWKISIDSTGKSEVSNHCLANSIAAIGWGSSGDLLSEELDDNEYYQKLGPQVKSSLSEFSQRASVGDLILCIGSQRTVQAVGVISGNYHFEPKGTSVYSSYCNQLPINWLVTDINIDFHALNGGVNFTQKTFYELWRFSVADVFELLNTHGVHINSIESEQNKTENYVLIIDEINRGNISKIFGELITLIEPSKRTGEGQKESLTLNLPYSGKPFSVPDNLYIIGTMNTADRSLALMDTALRRRFDFIEMMPSYDVFSEHGVLNVGSVQVDLAELLKTMNQRIEVLYDREHMLGHAFFIPVVELITAKNHSQALIELKNVFKNKVLPLLQEYFFEDWNRIRLVLGDSKKSKSDWLVQISEQSFNDIFGADHGLGNFDTAPKTYQIASFDDRSIWDKPETYQAIYSVKKTPDTADETNTLESRED
ncbi:AAA family ATPase [Shewanella sp. AC91-MNA-CIBAN-0169]|uniref:AAA family ATPase n=1 Tax=Shewanella sp. AC91-MNA-CIBAN-0169 TaxID=3140466 RepID=UPI00332BA7D3